LHEIKVTNKIKCINVQHNSSFCKGASVVLHTVGSNTVIFAVALTLCFKLISFLHWFLLFLSINNVTVMNLRFLYFSVWFLYFSVCLKSVQFFSKFSCQGNTILTVFSISEFSNPKHIFWTQIPKVFCIGPKLWPNYCNVVFLSKFGCHDNVICSLKNLDSIFELANPENPILRAKNVSLLCTKLKYVQFSHIFCLNLVVMATLSASLKILIAYFYLRTPQNPIIHS